MAVFHHRRLITLLVFVATVAEGRGAFAEGRGLCGFRRGAVILGNMDSFRMRPLCRGGGGASSSGSSGPLTDVLPGSRRSGELASRLWSGCQRECGGGMAGGPEPVASSRSWLLAAIVGQRLRPGVCSETTQAPRRLPLISTGQESRGPDGP